jgi:monothiol glutaredoxin
MKLPVHEGAGSQEGDQTPALSPDLKKRLDSIVQENDLVIFMKGTPDEPRCGFSQRAAEVYKAIDRPFVTVDIFQEADPARFVQALAEWADWPTLPQCWVKGELIGGSDIALEMFERGDLQKMLDA